MKFSNFNQITSPHYVAELKVAVFDKLK